LGDDPGIHFMHKSVSAIAEGARKNNLSEADVAVFLHNYVRDNILFGFTPYFDTAMPEKTLQLGRGHCNPQARLMVALFRAAGLNARFRPVTINNKVLRRVIQTPDLLSHVFSEVEIGTRWIRLDSYIVDPKLRAVAVAALKKQSCELGYGCHVSATGEWDGHSDSYSQVATPQMILELHEPVEDIEDFYRSTSYKHRVGPLSFNLLLAPARIVSPIALRLMNSPVDRLRSDYAD
jgi:hypothetical protein